MALILQPSPLAPTAPDQPILLRPLLNSFTLDVSNVFFLWHFPVLQPDRHSILVTSDPFVSQYLCHSPSSSLQVTDIPGYFIFEEKPRHLRSPDDCSVYYLVSVNYYIPLRLLASVIDICRDIYLHSSPFIAEVRQWYSTQLGIAVHTMLTVTYHLQNDGFFTTTSLSDSPPIPQDVHVVALSELHQWFWHVVELGEFSLPHAIQAWNIHMQPNRSPPSDWIARINAALEEADRVGVPLPHMHLFIQGHWLKAIALKEIVITRPCTHSDNVLRET
ncbi:hypothetical protein C8Q76DRAFT_788436 [Earliella scabrosa]|nr:hypothetical protein C8Q76DRAFT_788436 [Earliella scabrosa]